MTAEVRAAGGLTEVAVRREKAVAVARKEKVAAVNAEEQVTEAPGGVVKGVDTKAVASVDHLLLGLI